MPSARTNDAKLAQLAKEVEQLVAARPGFAGTVTLQFEAGKVAWWAVRDEKGDALD